MKRGVAILLLLIGACSWRSPNSDFYMMNSQGLQQISDKKIGVAVTKIKVPDLLDRAQMVLYEKGTEQIKILEFNRWGEALPSVLQSTIVNDLIGYLPRAYIVRTYFDNQSVDYNVHVEINNLKAYRGDKVILSVWWNITSTSGKTLLRQQGTYEAKAGGKSIQDLVIAQNQAVHHLSEDIANHLVRL